MVIITKINITYSDYKARQGGDGVVGIGFCEQCLIRIFECEKEGEDYFADEGGMVCRECAEETQE